MSAFHSLIYRSRAGIGRRQFLGAAAAAAAVLPARTLWADGAAPAGNASQVTALSGTGKPVTLTAADLKDFRAGFKGKVLLAQDAGYDQARRVWNGSINRHPALIARCESREDIVRAVQFARSHSLLTAVKGGGHSLSGQSTCDSGLMIDLSSMRGIQLDVAKRVARAQPGVLLAELDGTCQAA